MHYAVSHNTAAEIIYNRADSEKEYMGLTSWKNSPNGKILETDVVIAKNYLTKSEIEGLELIVSSFLDLAESRARRNIPMTMNDWISLLDKYLLLDNRDILKDAGKISHEIACDKALTEFEKYRVKQDKLYKSDFDLLMEETENKNNKKMIKGSKIDTYEKIYNNRYNIDIIRKASNMKDKKEKLPSTNINWDITI